MIIQNLYCKQRNIENYRSKPNTSVSAVKMALNPIWIVFNFVIILFFFPMAYSEGEEVKQALVKFMDNLAPESPQRNYSRYWGWNNASDPCNGSWHGVSCSEDGSVKTIALDESNLSGTLDFNSLCTAKSLQILSLKNNNLHGSIPEDIGNCKSLTRLYLSNNNLSSDLPKSLTGLINLKWLHIANNNFTGEISNKIYAPGLISFLAENNNFSGVIPEFDFSKVIQFNVSNNNLQGLIPDVRGKFGADSFSGNPNLCGIPLLVTCPPLLVNDRNSLTDALAIYSGYIILGLVVLAFFAFKLVRKCKKAKEEALVVFEKKEVTEERSGSEKGGDDDGGRDAAATSSTSKSGIGMVSENSIASLETDMMTVNNTSTLIVLSSTVSMALRFEDLLRAPAELIGRGIHGSLYKVMLDNGMFLAVKRIKDWGISEQDFQRRIGKVSQVKHPYVLPPVAYYCSREEKLLAYEYMENGSLFKMLYASQNGKSFDWGSRLNIAAKIAEALAYMHEELHECGIAHGNLKSSNILFGKHMDLCISEYGLMVIENRALSTLPHSKSSRTRVLNSFNAYSTLKVDIYAYGVILMELLTGKVVQNQGFDLVKWVNSVVREEWSAEVFDKSLISHGANEERMMNLLQVALKCTNHSPSDRPSMSEVADMVITLKEEEERSMTFHFGDTV